MILEVATIVVKQGCELEFEAAFALGIAHIERSPGFCSRVLRRGVEHPSTYLLMIEWESLEAHTDGFRNSDAFAAWRGHVGKYFAPETAVVHYRAPVPTPRSG